MSREYTKRIPLLVVGGGIGGLATALAVAGAGRDVHVIEKSSEFGEIGAGLQLAPNATGVLHRLGILDEVLAHAVLPARLVMRDALTGESLIAMDLGAAFRERFGFPYVVAHRADLLNAEVRACRRDPRITLEAGRDAVSIEDLGDGARVVCADGSTYECDSVIGADGLWSRTRKLVHDDGAPVCAQAVAYRATVPFAHLPEGVDLDAMTIFVGPGLHFVQYVIRPGELLNQVAVFRSDRYRPGDETCDTWGTPDELDEHFAPACSRVRSGLARIDRSRRWTMFDRLPIPTWTRNRITLLGDAAHPMLQFAAQGACQALEDAVTLGDVMARERDDGRAFLEYEARRRPRTARVQQTARWLGDLFHASGGDAVRRAEMFAGRSPQDYSYVDWLYAG
jgi:salicylate hydroxylase